MVEGFKNKKLEEELCKHCGFIEKINNIELILLPLSPKVCLIITKDKNDTTEIKEISQKEKVLLNKLIIKNSKQNIAYYEKKINLSIYNQAWINHIPHTHTLLHLSD